MHLSSSFALSSGTTGMKLHLKLLGDEEMKIRNALIYKDLLAGFLAAQAQNKNIMVWYDPEGNGTCGFGNQLRINTFQIK
jgi:hypothetical protein